MPGIQSAVKLKQITKILRNRNITKKKNKQTSKQPHNYFNNRHYLNGSYRQHITQFIHVFFILKNLLNKIINSVIVIIFIIGKVMEKAHFKAVLIVIGREITLVKLPIYSQLISRQNKYHKVILTEGLINKKLILRFCSKKVLFQ